MERNFKLDVIDSILKEKLLLSDELVRCSYLTPDGKYLNIQDHYEVHRYLVLEGISQCPSDAEQLLSDLGFIRFSWIGYITLATKEPTNEQLTQLCLIIDYISKHRDELSLQIQAMPQYYEMFDTKDMEGILKSIKNHYKNKREII